MKRIALLAFAGLVAATGVAHAEPLSVLADRYWSERLAEAPEMATQYGFHEHDAQLRDVSPAALKKAVARFGDWKKRLAAIDRKGLSTEDAVDLQLLALDVDSSLVAYQVVREFERRPRVYPSLAINSVYLIVKRDFAPAAQRLQSVIAREQQIPTMLASAKQNLKDVPKIAVELALDELPANIEFLQKDTVQAFASVKDAALQKKLSDATATASKALADYGDWLKRDLMPKTQADFAIGKDAFVQKLAADEMVTAPLDQVLAEGEAELKRLHDAYVATAKKIDPKKKPEAVQDAILNDHPKANEVLGYVQTRLAGLRQFLVDHNIATVPSPVMAIVQESPPFMRAFTLASMDTPGPYETKATEAYYNITLPDPKWTPAEAESYLRGAFARPVLELVSIHEAFPGHYLQFQWMPKMRSKTRKLFFCATNVEGWAHYTEQMMVDEGAGSGDPKIRLAQLQEALLRATRYVVGIRMHTKGMTMSEAIELFQKQGLQSKKVAEMETKRGTEDPTYLYYTYGKLQILKLRDEYKKKMGAKYSLRAFHDAFLAEGGIPLPLMHKVLLEQVGP